MCVKCIHISCLLTAYEGYQSILRNHVTNKAGRNWQALLANLGLAIAKRESLHAGNHGDPNNTLADVLVHWAIGIPTVEATWLKLLEAMSYSSMVVPSEDLKEVLLKRGVCMWACTCLFVCVCVCVCVCVTTVRIIRS